MAEVVSTGVSHMCDNGTVSVKLFGDPSACFSIKLTLIAAWPG